MGSFSLFLMVVVLALLEQTCATSSVETDTHNMVEVLKCFKILQESGKRIYVSYAGNTMRLFDSDGDEISCDAVKQQKMRQRSDRRCIFSPIHCLFNKRIQTAKMLAQRNLLAEICNSWLLLPVVHLPYPLLRMTGLLTQLGFSGLFQFYFVGLLSYQTAYSVFEMFMFRFRASIINFNSSKFYIYLKLNVYIFRAVILAFPILSIATFSYAIEKQEEYKSELSFRSGDAEIMCHSAVLAAPFSDWVMACNMGIWLTVILITMTATTATTIYLNRHLKKNSEMRSTLVVKMQKMLLLSLLVQTIIHGIMLGTPNALLVYAAFFGADNEVAAFSALICLTFHGFFSTLAMLIFTKPLQQEILKLFKRR